MDPVLNEREARILGALIEKERTTPEYYPLTMNALVNACNQKSNRDPVVAYDRRTVEEDVDRLRWSGWVVVVDEAGSRVEKYKHRFPDQTGLGRAETALLAELMLRGPQTAGEIHQRAKRMHPFSGLAEVQEILHTLSEGDAPRVFRLPRQKGRKERRYAHLLSGQPPVVEEETEEDGPPARGPSEERLDRLEKEIAALREEMAALAKDLGEFRAQFE